MSTFKFQFDQQVSIKVSGEVGDIIGRADYPNREAGYFLRYKATDGRAAESWWDESALENASATPAKE